MLLLAACVSHRQIDSNYDDIAAELEPGDRVQVSMNDGESFSFLVKEIRESEFVGDTRTNVSPGKIVIVPFERIEKLELVEQQAGRTAALVFGIPVGALLLLLTVLVLTW